MKTCGQPSAKWEMLILPFLHSLTGKALSEMQSSAGLFASRLRPLGFAWRTDPIRRCLWFWPVFDGAGAAYEIPDRSVKANKNKKEEQGEEQVRRRGESCDWQPYLYAMVRVHAEPVAWIMNSFSLNEISLLVYTTQWQIGLYTHETSHCLMGSVNFMVFLWSFMTLLDTNLPRTAWLHSARE